MKLLIIAMMTLTNGGSIELVAPSLEQCEMWARAAGKAGLKFEIEEFGSPAETVFKVDCKSQLVNTPDAEGEDV